MELNWLNICLSTYKGLCAISQHLDGLSSLGLDGGD
jgi:hypothetical protein